MDGLLTPLKTTLIANNRRVEDHLIPVDPIQKHHVSLDHNIKSSEDVLGLLQSRPSLELLAKALHWLDPSRNRDDAFNIKIPNPQIAPIIFVLIEEIIPNYWRVLKEGKGQLRKIVIRCLTSVAGLGAITARLRVLLDVDKEGENQTNIKGDGKNLWTEDLIDVLQNILKKDTFVAGVWEDTSSMVSHAPQKALMWKELISFIAAGRILSLAGEADHLLHKSSKNIETRSWLADGNQYAAWLGRNIAHLISTVDSSDTETQKALAQMLEKGVKLGYTGE